MTDAADGVFGLPLTPVQLAEIRELRDEIRLAEGGSTDPKVAGGQCGEISLCIPGIPGLERAEPYLCGAYVTEQDELVWDHCWCELPDGTIVDATADQFEEGDNVRLIGPNDVRQARYLRWEDFAQVTRDLDERARRCGAAQVLQELSDLRPYVFMEAGHSDADALEAQLRAQLPDPVAC